MWCLCKTIASACRNMARKARFACCCYALSYITIVIATGLPGLFQYCTGLRPFVTGTTIDRMCLGGGESYKTIAADGYSVNIDRSERSTIVYFPAFPFCARYLSYAFNIGTSEALVIAAAAFLLAAFVLFDRYLADGDPLACTLCCRKCAIVTLAVLPPTFFFRMAYTESMFLCLLILAMYGIRRVWPSYIIALIIGLSTATRSTGIALLGPFILHLWRLRRSKVSKFPSSTLKWRLRSTASAMVFLIPRCTVACWGIVAFMGYQWSKYGDPAIFVKVQSAFRAREPEQDIGRWIMDLITFEPVRSTYDTGSACYWGNTGPHVAWIVSLPFANPLYFMAVIVLLAVGGLSRWINSKEVVLGALLLVIPYVVQTSRQGMMSQARFSVVAFPIYIVLGQLLCRVPRPVAIYALLVCTYLLCVYTWLFMSGYWLW